MGGNINQWMARFFLLISKHYDTAASFSTRSRPPFSNVYKDDRDYTASLRNEFFGRYDMFYKSIRLVETQWRCYFWIIVKFGILMAPSSITTISNKILVENYEAREIMRMTTSFLIASCQPLFRFPRVMFAGKNCFLSTFRAYKVH